MAVYAAGRGMTGAFAARLMLQFAGPQVASSGAALVALALLLAGEAALEALRAPPCATLLLGLGGEQRVAVARRWMRRHHIPGDLRIGEFLQLRRPALHVLLYDGERQAPVLFGAAGADAPLAEVLAALCSLAPLGKRRLFDVEALAAPEALAFALRPRPLCVLAPRPAPLLPPCFSYPAQVFGLLECVMQRVAPAALFARVDTPSALLGLGSATAVPEPWGEPAARAFLRRACAAVLLLYVGAALLQALELLQGRGQVRGSPRRDALVGCTAPE